MTECIIYIQKNCGKGFPNRIYVYDLESYKINWESG